MTSCRVLCFAMSLLIPAVLPAIAAEKKPAAKKAPPGRTETLACRLGSEDRHARIAVVVIKGKTDSFAYYSKWKPRTCSIYLQRKGDMFSRWADNGAITTVSLDKGAFLIEHKPGEYHFIFRDIDRERYCGMDGVINGSLTIKRGSDQCILDGDIMVEGTPLGEAHANVKEPEGPLVAPPASASAPAAALQQAPAASAPTPVRATETAPQPSQQPVAAETPPPPQQPVAAETPPPPQQPVAAETPPAPQQPAAADAASPPAATGVSQAAAEKPAEEPSTNPFSAFFRSLRPRPSEGETP
jgi:hypothetical protein